jgi:hypothetical protein
VLVLLVVMNRAHPGHSRDPLQQQQQMVLLLLVPERQVPSASPDRLWP